MSALLERLKIGLANAQKRQAEVLKQWQAVQAEYQAINQEVIGYQKVLENETKFEEEASIGKKREARADVSPNPESEPEINKTQIIREALSAQKGMTPADVWKVVQRHIDSRSYVYNVLKRLKDRKLVVERKGRYYLPTPPKVEHEKEQAIEVAKP